MNLTEKISSERKIWKKFRRIWQNWAKCRHHSFAGGAYTSFSPPAFDKRTNNPRHVCEKHFGYFSILFPSGGIQTQIDDSLTCHTHTTPLCSRLVCRGRDMSAHFSRNSRSTAPRTRCKYQNRSLYPPRHHNTCRGPYSNWWMGSKASKTENSGQWTLIRVRNDHKMGTNDSLFF